MTSNRTSTNEAIIANASPTRDAGDVGWEQFFGRKIKFKGEGVRALKLLFLQSPEKHPEISSDLYMNGVILFVPWHDRHEYGIIWDTSVLPMPLEKSAICHAIAKTDHQRINLLKMARFMFDRAYPDGVKSVVNLVSLPCIRNCSQPKWADAPAASARKTRDTCAAVQPHEIRNCQQIANMRMAPINNQLGTTAQRNLLEFDGIDEDESVG